MAISANVTKGGQPLVGKSVQFNIHGNVGLTIKNLTGVTNGAGVASVTPGWDVTGWNFTAICSDGIYWGSGTGTADMFGDGSTDVVVTANPVGGLSNWLSSNWVTGFLIVILLLLLYGLYRIIMGLGKTITPWGFLSSGNGSGIMDKIKGHLALRKQQIGGLFDSAKKRLQIGNGY